jgi:hypothetical protein
LELQTISTLDKPMPVQVWLHQPQVQVHAKIRSP